MNRQPTARGSIHLDDLDVIQRAAAWAARLEIVARNHGPLMEVISDVRRESLLRAAKSLTKAIAAAAADEPALNVLVEGPGARRPS
jgi:hypothetical protein